MQKGSSSVSLGKNPPQEVSPSGDMTPENTIKIYSDAIAYLTQVKERVSNQKPFSLPC
jgi:hypothetical protein